MVSVSKYYSTVCLLVVVKGEGILSSDYATASLRRTRQIHTHPYTLLLTYLFISQAYISKSSHWPISVSSRWAGLQAAPLLDGAKWEVPHYWLLPTSKILLLPWLQGELPKCVSVCLVVLMETLASLVLKKKKTQVGAALESLLRC